MDIAILEPDKLIVAVYIMQVVGINLNDFSLHSSYQLISASTCNISLLDFQYI